MGTGIRGDYTGFSFGNVHSENLGITHVSGGDRYSMELLPSFQDKTVDVPGGDGTYYFGSLYKNREFSLDIAYDEVTEEQLRTMIALFSDRQIKPLVFDEYPYKTYYARVSSSPKFDYVAFDLSEDSDYEAHIWSYEGSDSDYGNISLRIYKGEASINFVCYDPYAHCGGSNKYLDSYDDLHQWNYTSGDTSGELINRPLLTSTELSGFDTYLTTSGGTTFNGFKLYNPGDVDAFFTLRLKFPQNGKIAANTMGINTNLSIGWVEISKENDADTHIMYDSKLHLFYGLKATTASGVTTYTKTGSVYNYYIDSGDFFNIPVSGKDLNNNIIPINLTFNSNVQSYEPTIAYDYLYF